MAWTHFDYGSGANPYIAFDENEAQRVIRVHHRRGNYVRKIKDGFYYIDDMVVFKEDFKGYDFIATFQNNHHQDILILFTSEELNGEITRINGNDWFGMLGDEEGRARAKAFKKEQYLIKVLPTNTADENVPF